MIPALTIALSGLNAQSLRLSATAANIAHMGVGGAAPGTPEEQAGVPVVYRPFYVDMSTQWRQDGTGAGVVAHLRRDEKGFDYVYAPDQPGASAQGLVAVPAVDLTREMVNLLEIKLLYKANSAVVHRQDEMTGQLLDILE